MNEKYKVMPSGTNIHTSNNKTAGVCSKRGIFLFDIGSLNLVKKLRLKVCSVVTCYDLGGGKMPTNQPKV